MENNEKLFRVIVYSENHIGLLSTVANTFTRRSVNIESLGAFPSDFQGIHRMTIKSRTTEDKIVKIVKQLEKKVEVISVFYYEDLDAKRNERKVIEEILKNKQ